MKRTRSAEEQIIGVLTKAEACAMTADPVRRRGVSEAPFYNWKSKYGGVFCILHFFCVSSNAKADSHICGG